MYPGTYDLRIYRGDTVSFDITYAEGPKGSAVGKDLTGAALLAQIRPIGDMDELAAEFDLSPADQTIDPGKLTVSLPDSGVLNPRPVRPFAAAYRYDIQATWPDATVQTLLKGRITVLGDVSR